MEYFKEKILPFLKSNAIWIIIALIGYFVADIAVPELNTVGLILLYEALALILFVLSNILIFNLTYTRRLFTDGDKKIDSDAEKLSGGVILAATFIGVHFAVAIIALAVYFMQYKPI